MIRAFDVVVLALLAKQRGRDLPLKTMAESSCCSISQIFDSLERLFESGLLRHSRKDIAFEQLEKFFIHALSFLIPGKILGPGQGKKISISESSTINPLQGAGPKTWVWPCANQSDMGLMIEPLIENLEKILIKNPDLEEFFSLIEILRFHSHPLRSKAIERMKKMILDISSDIIPNQVSHSSKNNELLEQAAGIISETGFRSLTLEILADKMNFPSDVLTQNIGSIRALQKAIGESCSSRAYAHFGQVLLSTSNNKTEEIQKSLRSFLDFLDHNEDYFRLGLWFYLERVFEVSGDAGVLKDNFFQTLENFFEKIPSTKSPSSRAILFSNSWLTYAWFRWVEFPRMQNQKKAKMRLDELKDTLIAQLQ